MSSVEPEVGAAYDRSRWFLKGQSEGMKRLEYEENKFEAQIREMVINKRLCIWISVQGVSMSHICIEANLTYLSNFQGPNSHTVYKKLFCLDN